METFFNEVVPYCIAGSIAWLYIRSYKHERLITEISTTMQSVVNTLEEIKDQTKEELKDIKDKLENAALKYNSLDNKIDIYFLRGKIDLLKESSKQNKNDT